MHEVLFKSSFLRKYLSVHLPNSQTASYVLKLLQKRASRTSGELHCEGVCVGAVHVGDVLCVCVSEGEQEETLKPNK